MAYSIIQPSFSGGEIAPSLYGRVDMAKYATALRKCRNFIVRQYGGAENRRVHVSLPRLNTVTRNAA